MTIRCGNKVRENGDKSKKRHFGKDDDRGPTVGERGICKTSIKRCGKREPQAGSSGHDVGSEVLLVDGAHQDELVQGTSEFE